jgi:hypothetical protein
MPTLCDPMPTPCGPMPAPSPHQGHKRGGGIWHDAACAKPRLRGEAAHRFPRPSAPTANFFVYFGVHRQKVVCLNHSTAGVIIAAMLPARMVCTYCNLSVFSSSMAKHIKDKHRKEAAAEQESRAGC